MIGGGAVCGGSAAASDRLSGRRGRDRPSCRIGLEASETLVRKSRLKVNSASFAGGAPAREMHGARIEMTRTAEAVADE